MSSINKVMLIGRLGKDPEIRYMPSGKATATVSMATSEVWKDKSSGEKQERTEWHNLVFFSPLAEIVGQYLRKGSLAFVEGRLQTRKWQDKTTGQDRYITEIVVNEMKMLGSKSDRSDSGAPFPSEGSEPSYAAARPQSPAPTRPAPPPQSPSGSDKPDWDEDIPF